MSLPQKNKQQQFNFLNPSLLNYIMTRETNLDNGI